VKREIKEKMNYVRMKGSMMVIKILYGVKTMRIKRREIKYIIYNKAEIK
jgi:hypothetical protein